MEVVLGFVIMFVILTPATYFVYKKVYRAYWAGYKAGARDVLNNWKKSIKEMEENE